MQPRALKRLGLIEEDTEYCHQESFPTCKDQSPRRHIGCNRDKYVTYIWNTPVTQSAKCFLNGTALEYWGEISSDVLRNPIIIESFNAPTVDAFLTLKHLQAANIYVDGYAASALPLQLAGLKELKHLAIRYSCMTGTLPIAWQWTNISTLLVGALAWGDGPYNIQATVPNGCGIHGPLPTSWPQQMPQLKQLYLVNNALDGSIPRSVATWTKLKGLLLRQNKLSGSIPATFASLRTTFLVLSYNKLSGSLPSFGTLGRPSPLQRNLDFMDLSENILTGESLQMQVLVHGLVVSKCASIST